MPGDYSKRSARKFHTFKVPSDCNHTQKGLLKLHNMLRSMHMTYDLQGCSRRVGRCRIRLWADNTGIYNSEHVCDQACRKKLAMIDSVCWICMDMLCLDTL